MTIDSFGANWILLSTQVFVTGSRQSPRHRPRGRLVEDCTDILTQYPQVSFGQFLARVKAQFPI
jgi:hypothetical protein